MPLKTKESDAIKAETNEGTQSKKSPHTGPAFPRDSLKRCLVIAQAIEKNNAGRPYDRLDIAKAIDWSPNSSGFRYMIISSGRYGLTEGGYMAEKLSLTPLGSSIVSPTDENQAARGIRQALLTPEVFRKVLEFYDNKGVPREDYFKSSLKKQFGISPEDVDVCYSVLMTNIKDYNLIQNIKGNDYLQLSKLGSGQGQITPQTNGNEAESGLQEEIPESIEEPTTVVIAPQREKPVPTVFISHSKNQLIVSQIKESLAFGNFKSEVAEERQSLAIPISEKVFGLMEKCNCAIINISADEEKKAADGSYSINENVLTEIGAAYLHYNRRVILLIDHRLKDKLPSNISKLAAIYYEGEELPWSAGTSLQKALAEFRDALSKSG